MTDAATGTIYALVDPRDGAVRYIGQTTKTVAERLAGHMAKPAPRVGVWISELRGVGLAPFPMALRHGVPVADLLAVEKEEITRRILAGEKLLNSIVPGVGRQMLTRRVEADRLASEVQTWRGVADLVCSAVGGPMSPRDLPLVPVSARAWQACQETWQLASEPEEERTPGDDNRLSKNAQLYLARAAAGDELWNATGGAWIKLTSVAREDLSGKLEASISLAVGREWKSREELSRYLTLVPWALVAVTPWADLAQRAGIDSAEEFAGWVSQEPTTQQAIAFLAAHGGDVFVGLKAPNGHSRRPVAAVTLSAMAAAHFGFELPELLHRDAARALGEMAKDRQLTDPMADLLSKLDPKALDTAFGPDITRDLDRQLDLPLGTSLRVLTALVKDLRAGHLGRLKDVVTRAGAVLPTVPAPDYWHWSGDEVPILIGLVGRLVEVGAMPPPRGQEKGQFLEEVRSLWRMDGRFEGRSRSAA